LTELSVVDQLQIHELIAKYSFAWDGADIEGFASLFTDQAVCRFFLNGAETPDTEISGRQALRQAVINRAGFFKEIGLVTKHFMPNSVITPVSSDVVQVRTQAMISWQMKGVDLEPRPVQAGYYQSEVVRTSDGWKFAARDVLLNGVFKVKAVYGSVK
jgi:hypothetical protein